jgi:lysyl-tRNA synthetase class I
MSDFLKKLKGVFVVEDPNAPQENPQPTVTQQAQQPSNRPTQPTPINAGSVSTPMMSNANGQVNQKFTEVLFRAMEAANLDGFDYFEFKQAINNLANMPMDEATRYKSAYAMAQTMGATPDKLIQTAGTYLAVLKQEQDKFQQAAQGQVQNQIGNKKAQIDNFEQVIKQKDAQIKQLTEEMAQHRKEMETLKTDIEQASSKVAQTTADFEQSYRVLVGQIQNDVTNMQKYLK